MNSWTVGCADPRLTAPARSLWTSRGKRLAFPPPWLQVGGCSQASQHPQQDRMNLISGNSEEIWRAYCYQGAISSGDQHAKQTAFKRAAEALVAAGRIDKWDPWVWLL